MNDIYELIQSYLDGTLPAEEKNRFEERLKNDPELAEIFKAYQGIESSMHTGKEEALQQTLQTLREKYSGDKRVIRRDIFTRWQAIAALLIIVAGIGIWLWLRQPTDLYRKYAVHTTLDAGSRSGNDSLAINAAESFNTKQYSRAGELLEKYIAKDTADAQMKLALGICYLEQDRYSEAQKTFTAIADGTSVLSDKARWYLALTYLKQKQYDQCRDALAAIPPGADVYEKAQELLSEISKKLKG